MARDRSQKPKISGGSTSSEDLLKSAWQSMGRTESGDRVESKESPSAILADAATAGQAGRTETAEEIAQVLLQATQSRQAPAPPAAEPPRQAPAPRQRQSAARPRRAEPLPPPPPKRRTPPRPTAPQQQTQQSEQRRSRRGIGWIAFAAFWLISSLVGVFFSDDSGDTTPDIDISIPATTIDFSDLTSTTISATPGATFVNIRDVAVGQCIESLPTGSIVNDVAVVACDLPHQYELFGNTEVDADSFPGNDVFELATEACIPIFGDYVGQDYFDSLWYIDPIAPTEEGWRVGDRAVNCLLYSWPDGSEDVEFVTGSAEGTGNARS